MHLFIIGNGFDLFHEVPCSYGKFNDYLLKHHKQEHDKIGKLLNKQEPDWLWSDFENNLGNLNEKNLVSAYVNRWAHSGRHNIENDFDELEENLRNMFHAWVRDELSHIHIDPVLNLPSDSFFINFNYTNYLETCYNIPRDQICYIHGDTANNNLYRPVVGHGKKEPDIEMISRYFSADIKTSSLMMLLFLKDLMVKKITWHS